MNNISRPPENTANSAMRQAHYQEVCPQRAVRTAGFGRSFDLSVARAWHGNRHDQLKNSP